jgi:hypothetical protein
MPADCLSASVSLAMEWLSVLQRREQMRDRGQKVIETTTEVRPAYVYPKSPRFFLKGTQLNVSQEADKAFMAELNQTDPKRYTRLVKAIQKDNAHTLGSFGGWIVGQCARCSGKIINAPFVKRDNVNTGPYYCSQACRDGQKETKPTLDVLRRMKKRIKQAIAARAVYAERLAVAAVLES